MRMTLTAIKVATVLVPQAIPGPMPGPDRALVDIPDDPVCHAADEVARTVLSPEIYRHSRRCWEWSMVLAEIDGLAPQRDALFVACMLHDLALGGSTEPCGCFAAASGERAADLCVDLGREDIAASVSSAISGHFDPIAGRGTEDRALHGAVHLDVVGYRVREVTRAHVRTVTEAFPRSGFTAEFVRLAGREKRLRPLSTAAVMYRAGLPVLARLNPLDR